VFEPTLPDSHYRVGFGSRADPIKCLEGALVGNCWALNRNPGQFTYGEKGETSPVFSPDGNWIAFINSRDASGPTPRRAEK